MKSDSSGWTLPTTQKNAGSAHEIAWQRMVPRSNFSRVSDRPRGVYSIPVPGGQPRLLRDNAMGGYPLPDGSFIVAVLASLGDPQVRRFWPETGREVTLPAFLQPRQQPAGCLQGELLHLDFVVVEHAKTERPCDLDVLHLAVQEVAGVVGLR
jgi:hypothetical protein